MGAQTSSVAALLGVVTIVTPMLLRGDQQSPASGDAPRPSFEVASIKQSQSRDGGSMPPPPAGQISARNIAVPSLIAAAYKLKGFQLIGGPEWMAIDRFDIDAKSDGPAPLDQVLLMMQSLLADRFKLSAHRETREIDGFVLVRVRTDRLGFNMRPSAYDCRQPGLTPPPCREGGISAGSFKSAGRPISALLDVLTGEVRAPVVDNTKLTGTFDLQLYWSPALVPVADLPSIFTAVQEQLGLKLEATRVSSEVFVIDHVEHPTPD